LFLSYNRFAGDGNIARARIADFHPALAILAAKS
jgi:hypothetical protein